MTPSNIGEQLMKKKLLIFCFGLFLIGEAMADIRLKAGSTIEVEANVATTVTCEGGKPNCRIDRYPSYSGDRSFWAVYSGTDSIKSGFKTLEEAEAMVVHLRELNLCK